MPDKLKPTEVTEESTAPKSVLEQILTFQLKEEAQVFVNYYKAQNPGRTISFYRAAGGYRVVIEQDLPKKEIDPEKHKMSAIIKAQKEKDKLEAEKKNTKKGGVTRWYR